MGISGFGRYAVSGCVAVAMLAGCGGSQPPIGAPGAMPQTLSEPAQDKHSGPLLYVSNMGDAHDVTVYPAGTKDPSPIKTISSDLEQPGGICLDGQGTLYVTDVDGWVVEYADGKTKPSKIITKGINTPAYCAIDSKGNLWVTNIGGPNVTEYLQGSKKPHTAITKGLTYPVALAIDHSGNMYVGNGGYYGEGPYSVVVYAPGGKSPSRTITDGVTAPNGIAVDAQGTLYVANRIANNVEKYRSGQNHPYQTITDGVINPAGITVNKQGWLYVVVSGDTEKDVVVVEYPPGSTTPSGRQISKGLLDPFGTAYSPPLLP
jgi:sugar lactone lactonase YvrE